MEGPQLSDIVDKATRSRIMRAIRSRDTSPERMVRSMLHTRGFRFRLHVRTLPGSPDIVLPKYRAAIFIHGCFWHRHTGCVRASTPKANANFWKQKFLNNVARDRRNLRLLKKQGWRVATIWECALTETERESLTVRISSWISGQLLRFEMPSRRSPRRNQKVAGNSPI